MSSVNLEDTIRRINDIDLTDSEAKLDQEKQSEAHREARRNIKRLHNSCMKLREATLTNYQVEYKLQKEVVKRIDNICAKITEFVSGGHQLFLYGSVGTGKDHLAFVALRAAARAGYVVDWVEGLEVYERIAGAYANDTSHNKIYAEYARPDVLCVSDPIFTVNWTQPKQEALRKLVRRRYDQGKTTWVTCNVARLSQAEEIMGEDTFDRLRERCACIECRWPSYRGTLTSEF